MIVTQISLQFEFLEYYIYVVEPLFSGFQDKFVPLSELLKLDLDYFKKHRLFQNLVIIVKSLHALGKIINDKPDFNRRTTFGIMSQEYLD